MEEVEVKREENANAHKSVLDYDEGFTPRYEKRVRAVEETQPEPKVPESEDHDVAQSGSVQENTKTKQVEKTEEVENARYTNFAIIIDTDIWNQIARLLYVLADEVKFSLDRNGMHVITVDPAHVAMITIDMPRESTRELYLPDGNAEFVVRLKDSPKLKNGSVMRIARSNSKKDLVISVNGLEYTISSEDYDYGAPKARLPQLNYENYATVSVDALRNFISATKNTSDAFRVTFNPDNVELRSRNADNNEVRTELTRAYGLIDSRIQEKYRSTYPREYLDKLVKAVPAITEMKLEIKDDYPLRATFMLPETVAKTKGHYAHGVIPCMYLLAPRME